MKYHGCIMEFTEARNSDILRAFRLHMEQCEQIRLEDLLQKVVDTPASRFWVSEERAAIVVSWMEAGKPIDFMLPTKREMYEEIYRRYLLLRADNPRASLSSLVERVVQQPAPKFYMAPGHAMQIHYKLQRQAREDRKKK